MRTKFRANLQRKAVYVAIALTSALFLPGSAANAQEASVDEPATAFSVANVFAELNHTDGDLGFHALIDGDPWLRLEIEGPEDRVLLAVSN